MQGVHASHDVADLVEAKECRVREPIPDRTTTGEGMVYLAPRGHSRWLFFLSGLSVIHVEPHGPPVAVPHQLALLNDALASWQAQTRTRRDGALFTTQPVLSGGVSTLTPWRLGPAESVFGTSISSFSSAHSLPQNTYA